METEPKYKRILLKISGEALADPQNIVRAVLGEPVGTVVTK